jgi:L-ascorbate metabolism protein UlaG (beta-lactamase superfamily)
MTVEHEGLQIDWLGYATVRLEGPSGIVVYLDPGRYGVLDGHRPEDGDLICVTHDDHYDSDGIERVAARDATIVVYEGVDADAIDRDVLPIEELPYGVRRIGEEDGMTVEGVTIWSVPGYNEPGGPHTNADGTPSHPKGFGIGYLVSIDGTTVFWPGDSDALEGHRAIDASVLLPPIGGAFTMDRHEAADLAAAMAPDLVVPIHYGTFAAIEADADAFATDLEGRGIPVALDERRS